MTTGTHTTTDIQKTVRAWLAEHWDPDRPLLEWRRILAASGWACPSWPEQWYGRGLHARFDREVREVFDEIGAVGGPMGSGMTLAAPTILEHGSDDLKRRVLYPTVTGEQTWCQLFSEPGAGSDLASLSCRAELDGDEWVVSGQKVWNTSAHHADLGMLLARTSRTDSKHEGITYFVVPMHQPGIEVRPLKQMNGHASFNEVFLTEARVPKADVIGTVGDGWRVALATLAHERRMAAMARPKPPASTAGRTRQEAHAEAEDYFRPYVWYPQRAGRVDLVIPQAQATGRNTDPVVRQAIAHLLATVRTAEWTQRRAQAALALGRPPGPEGSLAKLAASRVAKEAARVHSLIAGTQALLRGPGSPLDGVIAEILVSVPAVSIAGGTDEIQHNIVGERVLGLGKEPNPSVGQTAATEERSPR